MFRIPGEPPGPSCTAGSGANWHSRVEGRQRMATDEWKKILTGDLAAIWEMDISILYGLMVLFLGYGGTLRFQTKLVDHPLRVVFHSWTNRGPQPPAASIQASERSESRASLHSGNVAWTKIQLVAGYFTSFWGETQLAYPLDQKKHSNPLSIRYSGYLALSMGHWTRSKRLDQLFQPLCLCYPINF